MRSVPVCVIGRVGGVGGEVDALAKESSVLPGEAAVEALRRGGGKYIRVRGDTVPLMIFSADVLRFKPCKCKFK